VARTTTKATPAKTTGRTRKTATAKQVPAPRKTKTRLAATGAPTYLTPETTASLVQSLSIGNHLTTACDYTGISRRTVAYWMARGRKEEARIEAMRTEEVDDDPLPSEAPFLQFLHDVMRAQAAGETYAVATLRSAMMATQHVRDGDGNLIEVADFNVRERAAKDFLERRHRVGWSRGEHVEQMIDAHVETKVTISVEEQRERMAAILTDADEYGVFVAAQAALTDGGEPE